jgi:hypothetical protein
MEISLNEELRGNVPIRTKIIFNDFILNRPLILITLDVI